MSNVSMHSYRLNVNIYAQKYATLLFLIKRLFKIKSAGSFRHIFNGFGGVGETRTLAPVNPIYFLSREAPSPTWVLLQVNAPYLNIKGEIK